MWAVVDIAMTHELLWAETQRVPLVACREPRWAKEVQHPPECVCFGTGKVRSDVYRAVERAITAPKGYFRDDLMSPPNITWHPDPDGGRVLRPQPGVMACDDCGGRGEFEDGGSWCKTCGGSGTVPDPSEVGVVARAEALGRLVLIQAAISRAEGEDVLFANERSPFAHALYSNDFPGALAATLEAILARESVQP